MTETTLNATLTDRYIAAVVRTVPEDQRDDVAAELRASIADQIEARTGSGEEPEAAERAVLTELGDPDELAAGYTDRHLYLIGPKYYLIWWRLLKLLLWIVPVCVAAAFALAQVIAGKDVGEVISSTWGILLSVIAHIAFWTTLVFAILDRTTGPKDAGIEPWSLDRLPEPRQKGTALADMIASIVLSVIFIGVIIWDVGFGAAYIDDAGYDGVWMHVLNPELWPVWIVALIVLQLLEIAMAVTVYRRRGWSYGLAAVNAALAAIYAAGTMWLISQDELINPELISALTALGGENLDVVIPATIGFFVVGIAVWDAIDGFLKARRAKAVLIGS